MDSNSTTPRIGRRPIRTQPRLVIIPTLGAVTPILILMVNAAAFIIHHLQDFRWTITVLALVSGVMLNSWAALGIYAGIKKRWPNHPIVGEERREVLFVTVMILVLAGAASTSFICYTGLSSAKALPNLTTIFAAAGALLGPIILVLLPGLTKRVMTRFSPAKPQQR